MKYTANTENNAAATTAMKSKITEPRWDVHSLHNIRKATEYIIIHCSAGRDSFCTIDIHHDHQAKGWDGIGYQYVINRDGTVSLGRDLFQVGAHTRTFNDKSIGICLIGGVESDGVTPVNNFTEEQIYAMQELVRRSKVIFPEAEIVGHNDLSDKACPCFQVDEYLSEYM